MLKRMTFSFIPIVLVLVLVLAVASAYVLRASAAERSHVDLAARCARVRNDDAPLSYSAAVDRPLRAAFRRLFPDATSAPTRSILESESVIRCMNGRLYACFVGANLPCGKINASRENRGAAAWCKANPHSAFAPMAATGHDAEYSYKCVNGRAVADKRLYALDPRGFAKNLWTPLK